ncbi:MAG: hypothetical protein AAB605_03340 [Patescibacteria group bacterium]
MTTETIIIVVLGSSVVASLVSGAWNLYIEERRKETERREKLYGPLRLYLELIKNYADVPTRLREDMRKLHKETTKSLDQRTSGEMLIEGSRRFSSEVGNPAVVERWFYIDKVSETLKQNSGLIKADDWPLVKEFFYSLTLRELGVGKMKPREGYDLFSDETTDQATKQVFTSLEKLSNKVLNTC